MNVYIYIYSPTYIHVHMYIYVHTYRRGSPLEGHMDEYEWFPSYDVHMLVICIYTYMYENIYLHIYS